jgi:N utilization substance protein A
MSNQLMHHIEMIGREKGISVEKIIEALEEAMANAARKNFRSNENLQAFFNRETGEIEVYAYKVVAKEVADPDLEISLAEARALIEEAEVGDELAIQKDTTDLGRIAAQTAKQIIFQKVREAERENIYSEYFDRIGEIVNGTVKRFDKGSIVVDLGKYEAILRKSEQSRVERYSQGERVRAVIIDVKKESKDPQIELSRTSPLLLMKLFEMEVPEIYDGTIIIKGAIREPGERAKIAVLSREPDIDPVGACVGMRGSRVQNIIRELRNEKIDIIEYSDDPVRFVLNSLSPARISKLSITDQEEREMEVIVSDDQLSLAIGKRGQNVRLASILSGWKLDIKGEGEKKREVEEQMELLSKGKLAMSEDMELVATVEAEAAGEAAREEFSAGEAETAITDIPGIGPKTAEKLLEAGISTADQLASLSVDELAAFPGFGKKTAEKILSSLKEKGRDQ